MMDVWSIINIWMPNRFQFGVLKKLQVHVGISRGLYFLYSFSYTRHKIFFKSVQISWIVSLIFKLEYGKQNHIFIQLHCDISQVWPDVPNLNYLFWKRTFLLITYQNLSQYEFWNTHLYVWQLRIIINSNISKIYWI